MTAVAADRATFVETSADIEREQAELAAVDAERKRLRALMAESDRLLGLAEELNRDRRRVPSRLAAALCQLELEVGLPQTRHSVKAQLAVNRLFRLQGVLLRRLEPRYHRQDHEEAEEKLSGEAAIRAEVRDYLSEFPYSFAWSDISFGVGAEQRDRIRIVLEAMKAEGALESWSTSGGGTRYGRPA